MQALESVAGGGTLPQAAQEFVEKAIVPIKQLLKGEATD
jgi:hypothetical protein